MNPLFILLVTTISYAHGQSIIGLGAPTGAVTVALDISNNGQVVVGYSNYSYGDDYAPRDKDRAFRWSSNAGMQELGTLPNSIFSTALRASSDGSVIVGHSTFSSGESRAWRWTAQGGMQDLNASIVGSSYSTAVSANGAVIAGYTAFPNSTGARAWRWTQGSGVQYLTPEVMESGYEFAFDMADDGSVIIGSKSGRGFRWSLNSGLEFLFNEESEPGFTPRSISQDGQKIAGEIFAGSSVASLWTFGQELQVLGPPAPESTLVEDISLDGSVIVGRGNGISSFDNSYVWTSQGGFFSIEEYFLQSGMDIAGWVIESAQAISADGNVIAGYGKYNGVTQAFVASVPEPSSLSLLLAGGAVLMVGRRRR